MKNPKKAFRWIVNILKKHQVPFQITGGLAARAYGSRRPLNDIDIDIPEDRFNEIVPDVKDCITYGPAHFIDERWDLFLLTLNYQGQRIDISGAWQTKICDARTKKWVYCPTDLAKNLQIKIFGLPVPVIDKKDLIDYKRMLKGDHQKKDIEALLKN